MKVIAMLKKAATAAGLIRFEDGTQVTKAAIIQTKVISLADLERDTMPAQAGAAPGVAPELSVDFSRLFLKIGGEPPAHGWTIESAARFLSSPDIAALGERDARDALLRALKENKVPLEDLVKDAAQKDSALDNYETYASGKLHERKQQRTGEIARLESEMARCRERIRQLETEGAGDEEQFAVWQRRKQAAEEHMVRVVALMTNERSGAGRLPPTK